MAPKKAISSAWGVRETLPRAHDSSFGREDLLEAVGTACTKARGIRAREAARLGS